MAFGVVTIGRFRIFLSTKLIDSARLVVMHPHRRPLSHARVHFSHEIMLSQLIAQSPFASSLKLL